jgi:hypothetical protein
MVLAGTVSEIKDVAIEGAFIVAGAVAMRFVLGYLIRVLPMVGGFLPYAAIIVGALVAAYTSGIIRQVAIGGAVAGALGAIESLVGVQAVVK